MPAPKPSGLRIGNLEREERAAEVANERRRIKIANQLFPNFPSLDKSNQGKILSKIPSDVPPGFDLAANLQEAQGLGLWGFYQHVRNKSSWDVKQLGRQYQDFGNWFYALAGREAGFSKELLRRAAGFAQQRAGTSKPEYGNFLGKYPYGDDFRDQEQMTKAFELQDRRGRDEPTHPELQDDKSPRASEPRQDKGIRDDDIHVDPPI